ncbi:hypothetical protein P7C70_g9051, partial [Phenoliferia sp. Uapishka_3]
LPTLGPNTVRVLGLKPNLRPGSASKIAWEVVRLIAEQDIDARMVSCKFFQGTDWWNKTHLDICFTDWRATEAAMKCVLPPTIRSMGAFDYWESRGTPPTIESNWESWIYQDDKKAPAETSASNVERQEAARVASGVQKDLVGLQQMVASIEKNLALQAKTTTEGMTGLFLTMMASNDSGRARMDASDVRQDINAKQNRLNAISAEIRHGRATYTPEDMEAAVRQQQRIEMEIEELGEELKYAKGPARRLEDNCASTTQTFLAGSPQLAIANSPAGNASRNAAGTNIEEVDTPQARAFLDKGKGKQKSSLQESQSMPELGGDDAEMGGSGPAPASLGSEFNALFVDGYEMTPEDVEVDADLQRIARNLFKAKQSSATLSQNAVNDVVPPALPTSGGSASPTGDTNTAGSTSVAGKQPFDMFSPDKHATPPESTATLTRKGGRVASVSKNKQAAGKRVKAAQSVQNASGAAKRNASTKAGETGSDGYESMEDEEDPIQDASETGSQAATEEGKGGDVKDVDENASSSTANPPLPASNADLLPVDTTAVDSPTRTAGGRASEEGTRSARDHESKDHPYSNATRAKERPEAFKPPGRNNRGSTPSRSGSMLERVQGTATAGTLGAVTRSSSSLLIIGDSEGEDEQENVSVGELLLKVKQEGEPEASGE